MSYTNRKINESLFDYVPDRIADLFKSPEEKHKERAKKELEDYAKTDPNTVSNSREREALKKMQQLLKKIDPHTNQLPPRLNTGGSIDENIYDDIKATNPPFKEWTYDRTGKNYLAKGRDEEEAALYVKLRYPEVVDIDLTKMEGGKNNISVTDDYVVSIYTKEQEPMSEMKDKLRKIVKELMADMPPSATHASIKNTDASPLVKVIQSGQLSLQQITNISSYLSKHTGFQPSVKGEELGAAIIAFLQKNKVSNQILQPIIDQLPKQDIMYTGPGMKETKNKTKMNKKDLMEMIRNVIAEEMGSSATDVNNYKVMLDYNPLKFTVSTEDAKASEGTRAGAYLNSKFNTSTFDENKKYEVSTFEQTKEDGTIIRTLRIFDKGDGTIKENKMKLSTLKQIIKEEIQKVMEGSDGETLHLDSGNGLTKITYPQLVSMLDDLLGSKEETNISFPELMSLVRQAGPVDLEGMGYTSNWGEKSQSWFDEWLRKNKGLEVAVKRLWNGISVGTQMARDASAGMQSAIDRMREKGTSSGLD